MFMHIFKLGSVFELDTIFLDTNGNKEQGDPIRDRSFCSINDMEMDMQDHACP